MHRAFWSKEAQVFGESYAIRFREQFLESDAEVFDHVDELMNWQPIDYIYEIGCGNGHVLEYMSERFAIAEKLIGIDIDEALIRQNRARFGADRMQFVQADALEWMRKHARNSCLIVTNGGVFEYFLEKELVELFAAASGLGPIIVALIETIGIDHDLERDGATHVYGRELSFSHNYPRLLRDAGFQMHHESERVDQNGNRWLRIVAKSGF
jgi:trans-aconitate methyltransferase